MVFDDSEARRLEERIQIEKNGIPRFRYLKFQFPNPNRPPWQVSEIQWNALISADAIVPYVALVT
jgi:hypothetical protein